MIGKLKVGILGTTSYQDKMKEHMRKLKAGGWLVRMAIFDNMDSSLPNVEYQICSANRELIEWADTLHFFWDQRSMGAIFDLGMCFMARKRIKVVFLESKTFSNFMKQYEMKGVTGCL